MNVPPGTGQAIRNNAAARQENRIEGRQAVRDWRMVNHQNRWWYYHPNNTWSYYHQNRWVPWTAPATAATANPGTVRVQSGYRGPLPNNLAPAPKINQPSADIPAASGTPDTGGSK